MTKINYLTNKQLLSEIHRCKSTFCSYLEPRYSAFDAIVDNIEDITPERLTEELENKKITMTKAKESIEGVSEADVVFRVMTYEHVPDNLDPKKKTRGANQDKIRVNFPPFKHFIKRDDELVEVGRSHWSGGFANGHFDMENGRLTNKMGMMMKLLVERVGYKRNWRGYSYNEDMQSQALVHLCQVALLFDESKGSNPFAFYTQVITYCFLRILLLEKRVQEIRDDLLVEAGVAPSMSRQIDDELSQNPEFAKFKKLPAKRGRKAAGVVAAIAKSDENIE